MRFVQLTKEESQPQDFGNYGAHRIKVTVSDVNGPDLDENLFLFQRMPTTANDPVPRDHFVAVVSPAQLATAPIGAPVVEVDWPYFRSDSVELDCVSADQAQAVWKLIESEIYTLVDAMNKLDNLSVTTVNWYPAVPDLPPDSDSASS